MTTTDEWRQALRETTEALHAAGDSQHHTPFDNFEYCPDDICRRNAVMVDPRNDGNIILRTLNPGEEDPR